MCVYVDITPITSNMTQRPRAQGGHRRGPREDEPEAGVYKLLELNMYIYIYIYIYTHIIYIYIYIMISYNITWYSTLYYV